MTKLRPVMSSSFSTSLCSLVLFFFTTAIASPIEVRELLLGKPVSREISAGETHEFQINATANDYLRIAINSSTGILQTELVGPDGSLVKGVCDFPSAAKLRIVSFIANSSGVHRLTVRAKENARAESYEVRIEAQAAATDEDKMRLAAETAESAGMDDRQTGEWRTSIAQFNEALRLWRQLGDRRGELRLLTRLGSQYLNIGEPKRALAQYHQALPLSQSLADRYQEAAILQGMGGAFHRQNESQKALEMFTQSRQIFASISRADREASVIENSALVYLALGDASKALKHLQQAAQTYSSLKMPKAQCHTLSAIGVAQGKLKQPREALQSFNQALTLAREHRETNCEGKVLRHLGYVYLNLKEKEKSIEFFNQGLQLCRSVGNRVCEATALRGLGSVSKSSGDYAKSLEYLNQAVQLFRLCGERDRTAIALQQMADINLTLGNVEQAQQELEEVLQIKESVRANVASQDLRDSFFVSAQDAFALYVDVLMELHKKNPDQGHNATALSANERARARGLVELLAEAGADIRQGVSPELLERERSLQQEINTRAAVRARITDEKSTESTARLDKELADLTASHREVEAQIRATSPGYAALTQPQPLALKEIKDLIDEDTVLLEFGLGRKQSWLWAITRDSLNSFKLPPGPEIQSAAQRVYNLLIARRPQAGLTEAEQVKRVAEADAKLQTEVAGLSKMLLEPIAPSLTSVWKGKRLVIVGSGALEYLPFAALQIPASDQQPLIANHEVVNLPSASVLSIIRKESAGRAKASKLVAVLADPVFETDDPRIKRVSKGRANQHFAMNVRSDDSASAASVADSPLQRSIRSMERGSLTRLPFSREEANAIAALVPATSLLKATDFRASRDRATSGELSNYRIIHFATHGLLNSQHPELSGLVLSLVDEKGRAQDGFLRLHELYNLRLPAELVVLSACQTGLGKEIRGEGLIGLTRGFMYAGASRVVASLWQVDDLATAELMKRFYSGMLKDNLRPAAALRAAQLDMMKQKRWSSPYFWAAFSLQGEWR